MLTAFFLLILAGLATSAVNDLRHTRTRADAK